MNSLFFLQLLGVTVTTLSLAVAYACYKWYQRLSDDTKVWAIATWIAFMGVISFIAAALPGYTQGQ